MAHSTETAVTRQTAIIEAAMGVFLRYGFKKTSMDDLAQAAGISRQGLYLHFPTKESLFKAMVAQMVETLRSAARGALAQEDLDVEDCLLNAFDAMCGKAAGSANLDELLATAEELVGPVGAELEEAMVSDVARVLRSVGIAARWKEAGVSAKDLAGHLWATSDGLKRKAKTPAEYRDRMRIAVRLLCRGTGHEDASRPRRPL